jgi:L,D-transpeptidase YcbB
VKESVKMGHFPPLQKKTCLLASVALILTAFAFTTPGLSQPSASATGLLREKLTHQDMLVAYYNERSMKPIWVRGAGSFQPRIDAVIGILEDSWTHGLNPAHYRVEEIKALFASTKEADRAALDMLITDSILRYAHDLTGMRGQQSADRKLSYWREPLQTDQILEMISESPDPIAKLRALEPTYALYHALREELKRLAALPESDQKKLNFGARPFKPGKSHANVPELRARMGLPPAASNPEFYDEALAVEVIKLQKSYGLDTDGVIGPKTLEIINVTAEDKIRQIIANMERLRWIDQGRPDRYILVNIPSANLWAVDGGTVALEMPVIVGKEARPTYSFKTEITGVRFNPNWTVPPTIKQKDFLPALQQNPYALEEKGIRLTYDGEIIDPGTVDWTTVSPRTIHNINMVQDPGDDNPLGKVRVIMENPYNIYLHDTNNRGMFEKKERNLSSGCIRVSEPEKLAQFILQHNEGWSEEKTKKMVRSSRMRDVKTDKPIPVFITYQTVWLNTDGRLVYGRDVYGQDAKLAGMLEKTGAIHIPRPPENKEISL